MNQKKLHLAILHQNKIVPDLHLLDFNFIHKYKIQFNKLELMYEMQCPLKKNQFDRLLPVIFGILLHILITL